MIVADTHPTAQNIAMTDFSRVWRSDWTERSDGSAFKSNSEEVTEHVEKALEHAERSDRQRTLFHLQKTLGRETGRIMIGQHLFREHNLDEGCVCTGCELKMRDLETLEEAAKNVDCPAPLESFEHYLTEDY